jgi:AAA+ superfamily predicted ATPase
MQEIETKQKSVGVAGASPKENNYILNADDEYFRGYFEICSLLAKKEALQKKAAEIEFEGCFALHRSRRGEPEKPVGTLEDVKGQIRALCQRIIKRDNAFWTAIEASGKHYAFEALVRQHGLSLFEKKVALYFLYIEFNAINQRRSRSVMEIVDVFDLNGSYVERLKRTMSFSAKSPLFEKGILCEGPDRVFTRENSELRMHPDVCHFLAGMLDGEAAPAKINSPIEPAIFEPSLKASDIGYVKVPEYTIDDVIVDQETKDDVRLFLDSIKGGALKETGILDKIKKGRGNAFLFYGPPGTGKSMLAEAAAGYLGKKALIVEYPKLTSKWLGETDKSISNIFKVAKSENLVIIMDEADTLLVSRDKLDWKDSIRFVNELLQEIEKFEGEIFLTTNMDTILDSALERRLSLKVKFNLPDPQLRERIWKTHMPDKMPTAQDVDFKALAHRYDFTGGNVKNAVLNAVRKAASDKRKEIAMGDLIFGAALEKKGMFSKKDKKPTIGFSNVSY